VVEPTARSYSYVVPGRCAHAAADAAVVASFRERPTRVGACVTAGMGIGLFLALTSPHGSRPAWLVAAVLFGVIGVALFVLIHMVTQYSLMRLAILPWAHAGALVGVDVGVTEVHVRTPLRAVRIPYSVIRRVVERGPIVTIVYSRLAGVTFPRALLPEATLSWLHLLPTPNRAARRRR
jgi:hypothetical protein